MGLFSTKADKAKKAAEAEQQAQSKPIYKRVPPSSHYAGAGANGDANGERQQLATKSHPRLVKGRSDLPSQKGKQAGAPSAAMLSAQQARFNGIHRASNPFFTTDPNAPPVPSLQDQTVGGAARPKGNARDANNFFSHSKDQTQSGNTRRHGYQAAAREGGNVENPHLSADSGYGSVEASLATHSRATSENNYLGGHDNAHFLPELSLSEELSLEPIFSRSAFDEPVVASPAKEVGVKLRDQDERRDYARRTKAVEPASRQTTYTPNKSTQEFAHEQGARSERHPHYQLHHEQPKQASQQPLQQPLRQPPQQGHFYFASEQDKAEPLKINATSQPKPRLVQSSRAEPSTYTPLQQPQPQFVQRDRTSTPPPVKLHDEPTRSSVSLPAQTSSPARERRNQPHPDFTAPMAKITPPPPVKTSEEILPPSEAHYAPSTGTSTPPIVNHHDQLSESSQFTSPPLSQSSYVPSARDREEPSDSSLYTSPPQSRSSYAPFDRLRSGSVRSNLPPPSILAGLKVNKRGKILDEEGETIGELCEGDIMDCVRQRANDQGEVVDEYGSVVGRVRLVQRQTESPIARVLSPGPYEYQALQYYPQQPKLVHHSAMQPHGPHQSQSSSASATRRNSVKQQVYVSPLQQLTYHGHQGPILAEELRDFLATSPEEKILGPIAPLDLPQTAFAVELQAFPPGHAQDDDEDSEDETIVDHSDIFMPPPFVPARSPKRTGSFGDAMSQQEGATLGSETLKVPQQAQQGAASNGTNGHAPAPAQSQTWAAAEAIERPVSVVLKHPPPQGKQPGVDSIDFQPTQKQLNGKQPQEPSPTTRPTSQPITSDSVKSFSRPTVPAVPGNESLASASLRPASYAYKGEIPAANTLGSTKLLAPPRPAGSKAPPLPSFQRQAFSTGLPGSNSLAAMHNVQISAGGGSNFSQNQRHSPAPFSSGMSNGKLGMVSRGSFNQPLKRSPLGSHGRPLSTISASDNGIDDSLAATSVLPAAAEEGSLAGSSKAALTNGIGAPDLTNGKAKSYFSHAGRVTMPPPSTLATQYPPKAEGQGQGQGQGPSSRPPSVGGMSAASKKRSRFSFSFGKKGVTA